MEENLKRDVIREVRAGEGRILLHDEVEERPGVFSIIPIWEQVEEKDIMTPRNVFELMAKEGYRVCLSFYNAFLPDIPHSSSSALRASADVRILKHRSTIAGSPS